MSEPSTEQIGELLGSLYRVDSGRILATLIRLLGDFDLAEEAIDGRPQATSQSAKGAQENSPGQRPG